MGVGATKPLEAQGSEVTSANSGWYRHSRGQSGQCGEGGLSREGSNCTGRQENGDLCGRFPRVPREGLWMMSVGVGRLPPQVGRAQYS